jgi:tetratricopeptide (TPR) repeat protein
MGFRYPQPNNEDDFELFSLRLLRNAWNRPHLQQNGKRGERQDGIDLIDLSGATPFRGVQCKFHESSKTIPPKEIEEEVVKALQHDPPIDEFYILTTAKKARHAQKTVIKINQRHRDEGRFLVVLWHWEEIEQCIDGLDEIAQDKVIRGDTGRSVANLREVLPPLFQQALNSLGPGSESAIDTELDEAKTELDQFHLEVVTHKLDRVETRYTDRLTDRQRFRLLTLRANLSITKGQWQKAGELLLRAKTLQPEDERARANEALAYELLGNPVRAHDLAASLRSEFPSSASVAAIWVRTAPPAVSFEEVESRVRDLGRSDEMLVLSLAYRALQCGQVDVGISYAEHGKEIAPDAPQTWFVLAQLRHEKGRPEARRADRRREFLEADAAYGKAITLAATHGATELQAAARVNRGILRALVEDPNADTDYQSAIELSPQDISIRCRYAAYLIDARRYDEAMREAEAASSQTNSPDAVFLAAEARFQRNTGDDRDRAVEALLGIVGTPDSIRRAEVVQLALEILIEKGRWAECETARTELDDEGVGALVADAAIAPAEGSAVISAITSFIRRSPPPFFPPRRWACPRRHRTLSSPTTAIASSSRSTALG